MAIDRTIPVSEMLVREGEKLWTPFLDHPFLKGIEDGTLDPQKFRFYMIQDYLYLKEYARIFALGVAKAPDLATMRYFEEYDHRILSVEMGVHRGYMERLNISLDEAEQSETAIENQAYTDYMLARCWEGTAADVAVSVLACAVSYEFIGKALKRRNPASATHPFYGEWVSSYGADEYGASNRKLEAVLDRLTADASESDRARYLQIFRKCSICEGAFWEMAWRGEV